MNPTSSISSSTLDATPDNRPAIQVAAIGALAATVANVALWAAGRAAGVVLLVSPLVGAPTMQVGVVEVVLTTLLTFAVGWAVLVLAARHSRRWVRVVMIAAALVAVVSAAGPLMTAQDTATGALLAAMHLVTGAAFVATAARLGAR
jgi:Family of unknown function (DUF6069)